MGWHSALTGGCSSTMMALVSDNGANFVAQYVSPEHYNRKETIFR
jgi:hypothetical protein